MSKCVKMANGNYRMQVYLGRENGKRILKTVLGKTRRECEQNAKKAVEDYEGAKVGTVRSAISKYISQAELLSPTTIHAYERILEFAFKDIIDLPLSDLTRDILQDAINKESKRTVERCNKRISPKTVRNEYGLLASALKNEGISFDVRLPKVQHKNEELPPPEEVLNAIIGSDIELPCLLAMWMSLRLSEVMGLCYEDVKGDLLYINRVRVAVGTDEVYKDYAKTDSSIRILQIPPYILSLINNTKAEEKPLTEAKLHPIFAYTGNSLRHKFYKLMKAHNLDLSFHDLRHYYASISLTLLGLPSKVVQVNGGWSSPLVLNTVYSQTFRSANDIAFDSLCGFFDEKIDQNKKVVTKKSPKNADNRWNFNIPRGFESHVLRQKWKKP